MSIVISAGYDNVTMSRIADETQMSVRTLHRYFPTKADIVWGVVDHSFDSLRDNLQRSDPSTSAIDAISAAVSAAFADEDDTCSTSRARLALIATTPELQAIRTDAFVRWRAEITTFVAQRLGVPSDGLVPIAAGAAIQATIMEALAWWARENDPGSPRHAVAIALRGLAVVESI